MIKRFLKVFTIGLIAMLSFALVSADHFDPAVMVEDQISTDGTVTIAQVNSAAEGFIVIHTDNDGAPGPVAGFAPVYPGANYNVTVELDTAMATPTLYAMLHVDTGEVGTYEFGTVEGADGPARDAEDNVITPAFAAEIVHMTDQFVDMNTVTAANVVTAQDGWLVIHAGNAGSPGPVLGFAPVTAGTNADVTVELDGDITPVLFPMLHVDTGEAGVYEFGQVEGADGPVVLGGAVLTFPIWTTPNMRVADQIVVHGDGMMMDDMMGSTVTGSVLSDGPGFLVIHSDNGGAPGPVLGFAAVAAGYNADVAVELEGDVTPVLFPMLHVDTGEVGTYEFGQVEGADGPVMNEEGNVEVYAINAAPSITYSGTLDGTTLTVDQALIDATGWLVIHADNDGAPGMVLGQTQIAPGVNSNVVIELAEEGMTETVFPMLHYDTGVAGEYEFGTVEGADGPVRVGEAVVVGALTPESMME